MPTLKPQDFDAWLKANIERVQVVRWGEHHTEIALMFANDAIKALQVLIADICIHVHTEAYGRYASLKDQNDMADKLNDRILVALGEDEHTTLPTEEGTDGVLSDTDSEVRDAGSSGQGQEAS